MPRIIRLAVAVTAALGVAIAASACNPTDDPKPPQESRGYIVEASTGTNPTTFAKIGPAGGRLTAQSGALTFTLTIPPKALIADASIGMTPIATIGRYPFAATFTGAVQLTPDGLVLAAPAELVITGGPQPTDAAAFQFDGAGDGFHLLPFAPGQGVRLHLLHFSGAGYGSATGGEMSAVPSPPRSLDAVMHNAAKNPNLRPGAPGNQAAQEAFVTSAKDAVIADLNAASGNPGELGPAAAIQALGLERQLQLLGLDLDDADSATIEKLIDGLRDKLIASLEDACRKGKGDPVAIAQSLMALERERRSSEQPESTTFEQSFLDCVNSVINVNVTMDWLHDRDWQHTIGWVKYHFTTAGAADLTYQTKDGMPRWVGEIPLEVKQFTTTDPKCSGQIVTVRPTKLRVEAMPNINPLRRAPGLAAANLLLAFSPEGTFMVQCPQAQNFSMSLVDGASAINSMLYPASFAGETFEFFGARQTTTVTQWSIKAKVVLTRTKKS